LTQGDEHREVEDIDRRLPRAVRFSLTMRTPNPGTQIVFRWLTRVVVLVTV
jgi:hypothetical protein